MREPSLQIRRALPVAGILLLGLLTPVCVTARVTLGSQRISPMGQQPEDFTVRGTVVNAVTGQPIARALVGAAADRVFSGIDGTFEFQHLSGGRINFVAQKPGYFNEMELRQGRFVTDRTVELRPQMDPVVVKLWPQAVISGHVADLDGESIEVASVTVTAVRIEQGRKVLRQEAMQQVDEEGYYRIANLRPGTYYLSVTPRNNSIAAITQNAKEGYPALVYFPAAEDISAATPISLIAGMQQTADFVIKNVPQYHVSGNVTGIPVGQDANVQFMSALGQRLQVPMRSKGISGDFEVTAVPEGKYSIQVFSTDMAGRRYSTEMDLTVAGNVSDLKLALAPQVTIPVIEHIDAAASDQARSVSGREPFVQVRLVPAKVFSQAGYYAAQHESNGERLYSIDNVAVGVYWVEAPTYGAWYVQSMSSGSTDLLREPLVITPGAPVPPIEVVLRDDAAMLRASIHVDGSASGTPSAWLLVFPAGSKRHPSLPAAPIMAGEVPLQSLAPGEYDVYAFDQVNDFEYENADAIEPFQNKATHVSLSAKSESKVTLEVIRRAE